MINHFIIKYKLNGVVIQRSRILVSWRCTSSLFLVVHLYTLINVWLVTQKSNSNLINIFYISVEFDELQSEIYYVLQKREFNLTMSA